MRPAARLLAGIGLSALVACAQQPTNVQPHASPPRFRERAQARSAGAHTAREHLAAGRSWTRVVLEGDRNGLDPAVAHMLRAPASDSTAKRELARLLNLPLSEGDFRYVPLQLSLYRELVDEEHGLTAFVMRCFIAALEAAESASQGRYLAAYQRVERLESMMEARLEATDDLDVHAMAGNYALSIGAMTRRGRAERLERARRHLRRVDREWDALSVSARGVLYDVPAARVVYAQWLAELELMAGDTTAAAAAYERVIEYADRAATPAAAVVADVAAQRLTELDTLSGRLSLPLWPAGHDACVACHATSGTPASTW